MLENYYRINQAAGISVHILQNGEPHINACSIAVNNNQLSFDKKLTDIPNLDQLDKQLDSKSFIALNLSGKGILQKQIEKTERIDQSNFNKILPNAAIDDFYVQNFISGDNSFISIIRKTEADKWIEQLKTLGFNPLMLSLGPFPAQHVLPQLNAYGQEIIFNGHIILLDKELHWDAYQYQESALAPFPLKIESENINEKLIIPYAAAFQLVLASKVELIRADVPSLEGAFATIISNKKFQVKGVAILSVFFILLLINFIVFSWLNTANNQLAEQVSRSRQSTVDIQGVNDQIKQKETLLQNLGWDGGINKSALVDQLASLLPQELTWTEITINPIDISASRVQKSLSFSNRQIRVTGTSDKIIPVNEWIGRIKTKPWVKNIQLDSYAYNNQLNTGQFTVIITY